MAEPSHPESPGTPQSTTTAGQGGPRTVFLIVFGVAFSLAGFAVLAILVFHEYSHSLFLLLPLVAGFASAYLANFRRKWNWDRTITVVALTLATSGFLMLGFEGAICIAMASVVAAMLALIGAGIAWLVSKMKTNRNTTLLFLAVICPLSMAFENRFPPTPPLLEQTTVIEIDAPPEVVWRFVPAFPKITAPPTGLLSTGIAYPIASTITGEGIGAHRSCVLSTGDMPERITRWEPGRALEFDVLQTPPAMEETNPFFQIRPPHVEGYFAVTHGRFILTPLANGRTRVEGTSWFKHNLWPQFYWAPLTRRTVKAVHERVFDHIKHLSESASPH
jgi:hypothetical protein